MNKEEYRELTQRIKKYEVYGICITDFERIIKEIDRIPAVCHVTFNGSYGYINQLLETKGTGDEISKDIKESFLVKFSGLVIETILQLEKEREKI